MADFTAGNMQTKSAIPTPKYEGGLVRTMGNAQLNEIHKKEMADAKEQEKPMLIGVSAKLHTYWEAAKNAKWIIDERLARCIRLRKGRYEPSDLAAIKEFGGSEIFMMLTNVKTRSIESQIKDILLPAGEKPWGIDPTPMPELPSHVTERVIGMLQGELQEIMSVMGPGVPITEQMVEIRMAELMAEARSEIRKIANNECREAEQVVDDLLTEANFYDEIADFIKDFSTYLTAFMRGPFIVGERKLVWKQGPDGKSMPGYELKPVMKFKRVSAFDIYPAPAAKNLNDGYLFERMRIRPEELVKYRTSPGFFKTAVDATLLEHRGGMLTNWLWTDQERANIESRPQEITDPTSMIEVLLFHGELQARDLAEFGIKYDGDISDPVPVAAMLCGNRVMMLRVNKHPLGWKPYYSASFDPSADSIWGMAPPELMEDCQRMCNAAARAMSNNMAIGSGPQVEVHEDRVQPNADVSRIFPWKIWRTESDPSGSGRPAVNFFQPDMVTDQLMKIFDFFYRQAGEQLGVPAYDQGVDANTGGAGSTAHGLAMLMTASSKIMKDAIGYIDRNVIKKVVFQTWLHAITSGLMDYQGDIHIVARASEYLIIAEQLQARRQEFLAFTNNPTDMAIIGVSGRSQVLRETVKSLKMNSEDIVPPEWQIEAMTGQMQPMMPEGEPGQPAGGGGGGPAPGQELSEKPVGFSEVPPYEQPIGGAPPVVPLERMANM